MSRHEITDDRWDMLFQMQVAWNLDRDPHHDLWLARQEARVHMDNNYIRKSEAIQNEMQKDCDEERRDGWAVR